MGVHNESRTGRKRITLSVPCAVFDRISSTRNGSEYITKLCLLAEADGLTSVEAVDDEITRRLKLSKPMRES